jgi:hypothetical protein
MLSCYVHIGDAGYAGLFRGHDLFQSSDDAVDFHVFNARQRGARQLFLDPEVGLATTYAPSPDQVAHYVLFGFGQAGQAVALEAARLAHFSGLRRLRMTIVDDFFDDRETLTPAGKARRQFLARYPTFCPEIGTLDLADHARRADTGEKDAWTCRDYRPACRHVRRDPPVIEYVVNAEFIDVPAGDPDLVPLLMNQFAAPGDTPVAPAIIACFDDDGQSFQTAHRLRELLASETDSLPNPLPAFVYLPTEDGLVELLDNEDTPIPIHAFGRRQRAARYAQITRPTLQRLARYFHESYREARQREADEDPSGEVKVPDPWDELSIAMRLSNEDAAAHAVVKLRTINYRWDPFDDESGEYRSNGKDLDLPDGSKHHLARMEHNRFVAERLIGGWLHEDLPEGYDELPRKKQDDVDDEMRSRKRRPSLLPFQHLHGKDEPKDREQVEALFEALAELGEPEEDIGAGARRVPDTNAETPALAETTDGSRVRRSNEGQD